MQRCNHETHEGKRTAGCARAPLVRFDVSDQALLIKKRSLSAAMLRAALLVAAAAACSALHPADVLPAHARGGALYRRLSAEKAEEEQAHVKRFGVKLNATDNYKARAAG